MTDNAKTIPSDSVPASQGDWAAPLAPVGGFRAEVSVPGSKSLSNRYLVLAALAAGPAVIRGLLRSRDTELMMAALTALGASFSPGTAPGEWRSVPLSPVTGDIEIDTGLAGTVMRFLPPVAAQVAASVRFDGDEGARVRPMAPIIDALRALGVRVDDGGDGLLPFTVHGNPHLRGGHVDVDASKSSQFVSGLLLAAPRMSEGLTVRHIGPTLPSLPHIAMTVAVLRQFGIQVDDSRDAIWRVYPGPVQAEQIRVEPDLSNAGAFMCAAAAAPAGSSVTIPGWPRATTQPGDMMPGILEQMGARTSLDGDRLTVTSSGQLRGIDADLAAGGELAPQIAALATLADSPTRLRGIAHLRGHETDRLAALATEINRLGGRAEQTSDGLVITPLPLRGGLWRTYHDHRMAHAGAIVGLATPGVVVQDIATTAKTMPGFAGMWEDMLGTGIKEQ
ncbi:3-phosphoshikimate 1-carboxyvinyltransferase [Rarobacter incanus]|uniref:3-phosphoshikimate 1-carboxyvinyltransferase n=1 Tax=Rarobacter incanus TaxID=153494 RepID=A0A542SNP8_9MICO|nr:3-phosphoshikimate 1-carboxyvinyltransferase [Rarobacter incanus]TQK76188.1 3-phosphoshikimate 1-carboxyvinyltransferase [Rarobacter incanus]